MLSLAPTPTAERQRRFLAAYSDLGNIRRAAEASGVNRGTHYLWLKQAQAQLPRDQARGTADENYMVRFERTKEDAIDSLEAEARRRALEGSDVLLIFLLKGLRPEVYNRDRVELTGRDGQPMEVVSMAPQVPYDRLSLALRKRMLDDYDSGKGISDESSLMLTAELDAIRLRDPLDRNVIDISPVESGDDSDSDDSDETDSNGRRRTILPVLRHLGHPAAPSTAPSTSPYSPQVGESQPAPAKGRSWLESL
jgi:transposase-like protein